MAFARENNLMALFGNIRIERHFPLNAHFDIFSKSLSNYIADTLTSSTAENMDVSSAKSFTVEEKSLLKSFIKKRGPKMEPSGTPA